jgi:hypothetical protein
MHIASEGGLTRSDYRALVLVSKYFFTHMLYSDFIMYIPAPRNHIVASTFVMAGPKLEMLLERLQSNQDLRNYVRTCQIENLRYATEHFYHRRLSGRRGMYDAFAEAVMSLIGGLPRLLHITFSSTTVPCRWILHFATRPSLKSITIKSGYIRGEGTPQGPVNIASFSSRPRINGDTFGIVFSQVFNISIYRRCA